MKQKLIMIVAPSAMGKSTAMNEVVRLDARFSRVRSFTTRPPRDNDEPGQYLYLSADELTEKRRSGEIVTEVTFPTTGQTYGTLTSSYVGEFCLLDTLANSVGTYRSLPWFDTITISLTTEPTKWQAWFLNRYPQESSEALKRLEEAKLSIRWSLDDTETLWLVNDSSPRTAAQRLIGLMDGGMLSDPDGPNHARAILERIDQGAIWT